MNQSISLLLLIIVLVSCKKDFSTPLNTFFNELEKELNVTKVQAFKNAEVFLIFDQNIFSNELGKLYYDSTYHSSLTPFFDSLAYGESEFFDPIEFLRYAFHDKLNDKKLDLERMRNDYNRMKEEKRIEKKANPVTDAQLIFEDIVRRNLSYKKKGDTLSFILPVINDTIVYMHSYSLQPADDTFKIKGVVVNWVDNSKNIFLLNLVFSVKLIQLDRNYLIDDRIYRVGDTLFIPLEMVLRE